MDELEVVTSKGIGVWGDRKYELRLLTSFRCYSDSSRRESRTVQRYGLEFGQATRGDRRWFNSDDARAAFLNSSFSDLVLTEIPEPNRQPHRVTSPLQTVVGEYLPSVTFVMDYLQLDFCGCGFTMNSWPTITIQDRTLAHTDGGYRDTMCSLIGETVAQVDEYWDAGLVLQFSNTASIRLALRVGTDFPGPEVATFHTPTEAFAIIWSAGEEPYD